MDELTFLLILAGIGIVLLVAMFTYYRHHKKIHDEIQDFNRHHDLDDILLHEKEHHAPQQDRLSDEELPTSFNTRQHDNFDIDSIFNKKTAGQSESFRSEPLNTAQSVNYGEHPAETESRTENIKPAPTSSGNSLTGAKHETIQSNEAEEKTTVNSRLEATKNAPKTATTHQPAQPQIKKPQQTIEVIYEPLPKGVNDLILSFTIITRGDKFTGSNLKKAFEDTGLRFGEMNIFHYPGDRKAAATYALFSAANLVEPGTFDLDNLPEFTSPGISLFMRLPTRKSAFDAFDEFLQVSRLLAQKLGGELCDEARNQLTQQSISHKREQIKKLQFELTKAKKIAELSK